MRIIGLKKEAFTLNGRELTEAEAETAKTIELDFKRRFNRIYLIERNMKNGIEYGFLLKYLKSQLYSNKIIIYQWNSNINSREIMAELEGDLKEMLLMHRELKERNHLLFYKGVLASDPASEERPSYFSSDRKGNRREQNFNGFLVLAALLALSNNFMLFLQNTLKYGFLLKKHFSMDVNEYGYYFTLSGFILFFALAHYISVRRDLQHSSIKPSTRNALQISLCLFIAFYPLLMYQIFEMQILNKIIVNMIAVVSLLKIISFFIVLNSTKEIITVIKSKKASKEGRLEHFIKCEIDEENYELLWNNRMAPEALVTAKNVIAFIFMPTLCFQLTYPRTKSINYISLATWTFKMTIGLIAFYYMISHQFVPVLEDVLNKIEHDSIIGKLRAILRLSMPSTIAWVLSFMNCFHFFLNILAELTYFADRQFYKEWWNCKSFEEYWKFWNLPVHKWFVRHLYNVLLKINVPNTLASFIIFFCSAIGHEYVVSLAIGKVSYWAFIAMLMQFFIILFEKIMFSQFKRIKETVFGNVMFWCSFCILGQPAIALSYFIEYTEGASSV